MDTITVLNQRRAVRLLAGFIAAAALLIAIAAGPAPKANADLNGGVNYFCKDGWLSPYGQAGDRCFAGRDKWGHIHAVAIETKQRAGCVNYAGYYYELYTNWKCTGSYSVSELILPKDGGSYMGVIRNNNLSYGGTFSGREYCCYFYG